MKFEVYSELEAFEEVILFKDESPNWNSVFASLDTEILLNISDESLEKELIPGTLIFEFTKAKGGKPPIALKFFFDEVLEDKQLIIKKPRAAFLLKISNDEAVLLQANYGIIVQASNKIKDVLSGSFAKILPEDAVIETGENKGWKSIFQNKSLPPMNTLVLSDNFLFSSKDGISGTSNLIQILNALLPEVLDVEFHFLVIANPKTDRCEKISSELKKAIYRLGKPYKIRIEIIFSETIHKRIVVSNYFMLTSDKGFDIFKKDLRTVRETNDIRMERIFDRSSENEGDSQFKIAQQKLKEINKICKSVDALFYGDCKDYNSMENRLIRDLD